jgi:hypothetical protein
MVIDSSGNVGLGTIGPSYPLTISNANGTKLSLAGGSSQNGMRFESSGGGNIFYLYSYATGLGFYNVSSSAQPLTIFNSGGVSVGNTTDPGATNLSVTGAVQTPILNSTSWIGAYGNGAGSGQSTTVKAGFASSGAGGNLFLASGRGNGAATTGYIAFGYSKSTDTTGLDAAGEFVRFHASGGVSIGNTTDSGAKSLNVSGLIFPQQAATASAPAYVKGAIYFDTTLNKLRVGGATAWETITSV